MPESKIIIIDTSDYMRNGDYSPSRYEAEIEVVQSLATGRLRVNPENLIGVISSGKETFVFLIINFSSNS